MKIKIKYQSITYGTILGIAFFGFVYCIFGASQVSAAILQGAQVATPQKNGQVLDQPMEVYGYAAKGSTIHVWIDGKYIGGTKVKNPKKKSDANGTFLFTAKKTYRAGKHTLKTRVIKGNVKSDYIDQTFSIPEKWNRKLDGKTVKLAEWNKLPYGVMIENTLAARPQAGLSEASVVYETLAEGGVTRFLAIFPQGVKPKSVGPVRSARYYYVDLAAEYQALFLHAGGAPDAYTEIKKLLIRSYDGLSKTGAKYMYRKCYGVHCLFTDYKQLARVVSDAKLQDRFAKFRGWKFKAGDSAKNRPKHSKTLTINFNTLTNKVDWKYDYTTNTYKRFTAGIASKDRNTNKQLAFSNIIVQRLPKEKIVDRKGRIVLPTTGAGTATLYRDGKEIKLRWKKPAATDHTLFYDLKGKEIEFNTGNTWVELVPGDRKVTYK